MIGSLTGTILETREDSVLIAIGGIGINVHCTPGTCRDLRIGDTATLATSLVVREDSLTLFGFADADQRETFLVLQSVTGVGPRLALSVLTALSPDQLRAAVHADDTATLTTISGVGRKGAQRMVLELADRLAPPSPSNTVDVRGGGPTYAGGRPEWQDPVRRALVGLGWSDRDAQVAVTSVHEDIAGDVIDQTDDVATLLKLALRSLDSR